MTADKLSAPSHGKGRSFPKSSRILRTVEFRRVYDNGFRFTTSLFTAFCLENRDETRPLGARVGFTTPRALGNSVKRNRIKRRTREAIRQALSGVAPQWDIVLNPRKAALDAPFTALENEVRKLVERCRR